MAGMGERYARRRPESRATGAGADHEASASSTTDVHLPAPLGSIALDATHGLLDPTPTATRHRDRLRCVQATAAAWFPRASRPRASSIVDGIQLAVHLGQLIRSVSWPSPLARMPRLCPGCRRGRSGGPWRVAAPALPPAGSPPLKEDERENQVLRARHVAGARAGLRGRARVRADEQQRLRDHHGRDGRGHPRRERGALGAGAAGRAQRRHRRPGPLPLLEHPGRRRLQGDGVDGGLPDGDEGRAPRLPRPGGDRQPAGERRRSPRRSRSSASRRSST